MGFLNSFFGWSAGNSNTEGFHNAFFGSEAGISNTRGQDNAFFGSGAGSDNTTESRNTFIGAWSGGAKGIFNATAIGNQARVERSDSLVLGNNANVGIGINAPTDRLHVSGTGIIRARVNSNDNAGLALSLSNQPKWSLATLSGGQFQIFNDATGQNAVSINSVNNNFGIGTSPSFRLHVIDPSNTGLRVQTNLIVGIIRVRALVPSGTTSLYGSRAKSRP